MKEVKVKVVNPTGLHARPASLLVKEAAKYKSSITLTKNGKDYNVKSIMSVMAMGAAMGEELVLKVNGEDEDVAATTIKNLIESFKD